MTNKYRYFYTMPEAHAFVAGLETASDGSIHHVKWTRLTPHEDSNFHHVVTWVDEASDSRRLQQEEHKKPAGEHQ